MKLIPLLIALLLLAQPATAQTNCAVNAAEVPLDSGELDLWNRVNAFRVQRGLNPLTISTELSRASLWHARDMAANGYLGNNDSLSRAAALRASDCGFSTTIAESAYDYGWPLASYVFADWQILAFNLMINPTYTRGGLAHVNVPGSQRIHYWVITVAAQGTAATPTRTATATNTPLPTSTPQPTATSTPTPEFNTILRGCQIIAGDINSEFDLGCQQ